MRKICIVTSTRADWGLLQPVAEGLRARADVELQIVATNMHLIDRFGATASEIEKAGFDINRRVPIDVPGDDDASRAISMSLCLSGMTKAFSELAPDIVVILGDRYEMLAVASAAAMMHIPIAHIAGGTVSFGAIDDSIRHAITKLAALHLVETEDARRRVVQMGEDPDMVIRTGAIGVWNITNRQLLTLNELQEQLDGFSILPKATILGTFHPATLDPADPGVRCRAMLEALDRYPSMQVVITYPNSDARSTGIIDAIEAYADANPGRVKVVKSLGMLRYLSLMQFCCAVVGNSSSGIVEAASLGVPAVDIGIRQKGRTAAKTVVHCGDSADEIAEALNRAVSPDMQQLASERINPYAMADTRRIMVEAIAETPLNLLTNKTFHDIDPKC